MANLGGGQREECQLLKYNYLNSTAPRKCHRIEILLPVPATGKNSHGV